jgi:hypothetical protein
MQSSKAWFNFPQFTLNSWTGKNQYVALRQTRKEMTRFHCAPIVNAALIAAIFALGCAGAQESRSTAPDAPPAFEAASVKRSAPDDIGRDASRDWGDTDRRVNLRHVTVKFVLMHVADLLPEQITGPGWLDTQFFDIQAIVPAGTPTRQIPLMLQSLLAERFKMKFHREPYTAPIYALAVAKGGPKLTQTKPVEGQVKDSSVSTGEGRNRPYRNGGKGAAWKIYVHDDR